MVVLAALFWLPGFFIYRRHRINCILTQVAPLYAPLGWFPGFESNLPLMYQLAAIAAWGLWTFVLLATQAPSLHLLPALVCIAGVVFLSTVIADKAAWHYVKYYYPNHYKRNVSGKADR